MSYQLENRHIHYFLAVAEELHFRKAAEKLYISQPGLSRQIKLLEEELGIQLFSRLNRKVALTKAGEYLKTALGGHIKSLEHIIDHAKHLHEGLDGNLNFGYVGSAIQELIPNLILQIQQEHRNVVFSLKEMDNQRQIDSLFSQDIDLGFVRLDRVPRGLAIHPVLTESFCLVLPKNHPIDAQNFKNLEQFKNESFILFDPSYSPTYYEKVMQIFDDSGYSPIVSHNTIHASSIYRLVENNLGISIVPKSLQLGYNMEVKFIELKNIRQQTVLSAVWNKSNSNPILLKILNTLHSL